MSGILYLVRHGESVYNAESRIQGHADVPLSELGRLQGEAVAEALAGVSVDAIYSSPLLRALDTARCIAGRHRVSLCTDPRLMEIDVGIFEGRLKSELVAENSPEFVRWLSGDDNFTIPGGESRRQLAERGCEALRSIAAYGHRAAVVVTHGGLLSATLRSILKLSQPLPPFSLQNGSITRVAFDGAGEFSLLALNETEHLQAIGLSKGGDL